MPLQLRELNHVMITVADLDRSVRFYRDILGLTPLPRPAFPFPGAWFALGKQELHLVADPSRPYGPSGTHHFALWVEDHAAATRELREKGWPHLRGPNPRPDGVLQLFVTDPDGYVFELMSAPPNRPNG
jgi:catechol 2,3-dioxygenase-like lactoylglutathione lyase family enzyme